MMRGGQGLESNPRSPEPSSATHCVILDTLLSFARSQFCHLQNGVNNSIYDVKLL